MKKLLKFYLAIWLVLLAIYDVVAFSTYGVVGEFYKFDNAFLICILITNIIFVLQFFFVKIMVDVTENTHKEPLAEMIMTAKNCGFLVVLMLGCVITSVFSSIPVFVYPITAFSLLLINVLVVALTTHNFKKMFLVIGAFLNKKKVKYIALPIIATLLLIAIILPTLILPMINYNKALKSIENGDNRAACSYLIKANNYKDAKNKLKTISATDESLEIYNAKIGDNVIFGEYEQDANVDNGNEPLEWTVLDRKGNKVLLITSHCIEKIQYHTSLTSITWEKCTLRNWLNSKFIEIAFNDTEKKMLSKTYLSDNNNPTYISPKAGKSTRDKVFVLSYYEAKYYLKTNEMINVPATEYVDQLRAHTNSETGAAWWWLRTPGQKNTEAMTNHFHKQFSSIGYKVNHEVYTVRPCIWVEL